MMLAMHPWLQVRRTIGTLAVLGMLASVGCGGNDASAFPPGLQPLADGVGPVAPPAPTSASMYPEAFTAARGETSDFIWVHASAYVHAPLSQVMAAMLDPAVNVDRRRVQEFTVMLNDEPTYPNSFRIHNVSHDILTVEFDLDYRLGLREGTSDAPVTFDLRYQKTYGTTFITLLAGSVEAHAVNDSVTQLDMVRELKSAGSGADDVEQYLRDFVASVQAKVHGQALPNYQ